ncbi:proline-rich protein 3-like [Papaver somniferum]|uniref:proline-rich protein 3-like n=1 Tax=Papaver somniferum TaxID=3469 RepID=UPI000E6FF144|nr:proline-rich protein 3-like [Papaver somniferum]
MARLSACLVHAFTFFVLINVVLAEYEPYTPNYKETPYKKPVVEVIADINLPKVYPSPPPPAYVAPVVYPSPSPPPPAYVALVVYPSPSPPPPAYVAPVVYPSPSPPPPAYVAPVVYPSPITINLRRPQVRSTRVHT